MPVCNTVQIGMPQLLLGPLLRYVSRDAATIWVETDRPCTVGILDVTTPTFSVWGHHYALVIVRGLAPASAIAYTLTLDVEQRWPLLDSPYPPSVTQRRVPKLFSNDVSRDQTTSTTESSPPKSLAS